MKCRDRLACGLGRKSGVRVSARATKKKRTGLIGRARRHRRRSKKKKMKLSVRWVDQTRFDGLDSAKRSHINSYYNRGAQIGPRKAFFRAPRRFLFFPVNSLSQTPSPTSSKKIPFLRHRPGAATEATAAPTRTTSSSTGSTRLGECGNWGELEERREG